MQPRGGRWLSLSSTRGNNGAHWRRQFARRDILLSIFGPRMDRQSRHEVQPTVGRVRVQVDIRDGRHSLRAKVDEDMKTETG